MKKVMKLLAFIFEQPSYIFKGDISRFFIFHCKFLLYVGFYVVIKNPDHFSYGSVIK